MPYQLHCALVVLQPVDELDNATLLDERLEDTTLADERIDDDAAIDEGAIDEDETTLDFAEDTDEALPPQIAPVTAGVSTAPLVLTCTPKETV